MPETHQEMVSISWEEQMGAFLRVARIAGGRICFYLRMFNLHRA